MNMNMPLLNQNEDLCILYICVISLSQLSHSLFLINAITLQRTTDGTCFGLVFKTVIRQTFVMMTGYLLYLKLMVNILAIEGTMTRKYITTLTSKGRSSIIEDYQEVPMAGMTAYLTVPVSTAGSCAILCTKDSQNACQSFKLSKEKGNLMCGLGADISRTDKETDWVVYEKSTATTASTEGKDNVIVNSKK